MKNIRRLYYENSIFRFMISYAGVLLIPLLVCLMSYQVAFNTVKSEIQENNLAMLNRSKNRIDEEIRLINSLMMQSVNNQNLLAMTDYNTQDMNNFYYNAPKAIKELNNTFRHANTPMLDNVYIYLKDTDYIVTRYDMYKAPFFYYQVLKEKGDFGAWSRQMTDKNYYRKYFITDTQIRYVQMLPFAINKPIKGAIVCVVNKNVLGTFFDNIKKSEGTSLFIKDQEGQAILNLSDGASKASDLKEITGKKMAYSQKIDGKKSIVLVVKSDETGWEYTLVLPENEVMHKLTQLKITILALFALALAIGIIISYYMASKSGKPIEEMKRFLDDAGLGEHLELNKISTTRTLSGTFAKIASEAQKLTNEIEKQKPYVEVVLLQKLLKGEFANEQEIYSLCRRTKINFKAESYWVVNFRVFINNDMYNLDQQTLEEANMLVLLIKELLKRQISRHVYFYDLDQLTTAVIIPKDEMHYDQMMDYIRQVNQEIVKEYQVTPFWGISGEVTDLVQIWRAFEQAKKALAVGVQEESNNMMEYNNIIEDQMSHYYPLVFENQLMTYTREADEEGVKKLFQLLYVENFEKRVLDKEAVRKLYLQIKRTAIKLINEDMVEEYIEKLNNYMFVKTETEIKSSFEEITNIFLSISSGFNKVKKHQQTKLISRIIHYLDEAYVNPNLGLGMVATKFNISEGYVSSLFKEQADINFTDHVEQLRINKACELLKSTKLSINEISEQVGYNSVQSFRRAFKRLHDFSPSELRKTHK